MKVLVACEYSGTVRDAFRAKGHDAYSCDILPTLGSDEYHIQDDVFNHLDEGWDLMIAHPPCTYLTVAGNRWYANDTEKQNEGLEFVLQLAEANIPKIAIENPIGRLSTLWRKPDQIIQPYDYGHDASKATCLWLKGLPRLVATNTVPVTWHTFASGKRWSKWYYEIGNLKGEERTMARNKTFSGIASAMAEQWS